MTARFDEMVAYLKLAQAYRSRASMPDRDRALLLSAVTACELQMHPLAELCRKMILQSNPGHMLRKYDCVDSALEDSDFVTFLRQVRRKIPVEKTALLLAELEYRSDIKKSDYVSQSEYAAALLGVDVAWIKEHFGQ